MWSFNQMKILERSGLDEETCLPSSIYYIPAKPIMESLRPELEVVILQELKLDNKLFIGMKNIFNFFFIFQGRY